RKIPAAKNGKGSGISSPKNGNKNDTEVWQVGARIRDMRMSYGLTQEELAHRSGLTKGFISQLERDLTSPSLESLVGILRALDTDIAEFFRNQDGEQFIFGPPDCLNADTYPEVSEFSLMVPGAANCDMEPAMVTFEPGQEIEENSHAGEEFGYVLQGKVMVSYGQRQAAAGRGDCFYFVSGRSHKVSNPFAKPAKVLWISSPPSF
ncbi:MAG: cupin domain-containing protein, partial [bacterium]